MARHALIAGNWKMNGTLEMALGLTSDIVSGLAEKSDVEVVVCPPFPYLSTVLSSAAGSPLAVGAQNVSQFPPGAFTGEVAGAMLADLGCRYVLVGHSERRQLFGETSSTIAQKARVVAENKMRPIVCVGETLEERQAGRTEAVIAEQLAPFFADVPATFGDWVVAYEPVWAIGTGETATPDQAQQVHEYIRAKIAHWDSNCGERTRILYGGSMKPDNAADLLAMTDVDGGLIGGAALTANAFLAICDAV